MAPGRADSTPLSPDHVERERRIDETIAAFHEAEESGAVPDPAEWVRRHPDLAPELEQYFRDNQHLGAIWGPSRFGRYRLGRRLGWGSMGAVYEAEDPRDGRRIAVKILPPDRWADPRAMRRFDLEREIVAGLRHPNIVPLLESGRIATVPYYVMPLVDGTSLQTVLHDLQRGRKGGEEPVYVVALPEAREDPAPLDRDDRRWRASARIGLQAARALAYAHGQEVIHRDIKPANILLDREGIIYVTDFGVARRGDQPDLTETGELVGALRFLAPERWHHICDPRSDIYSLGLVLYELATSRRAFEAPTREQLIRDILDRSPPRPRRVDRSIPKALEGIILAAIDREPAHRYPSARLLAGDLERFLDGRPVRPRRAGPLRRSWAWSRRHKWRAAAGVLAILAPFLALALVAWTEGLRAEAALARERVARAERDASESRAKTSRAERDAAEAARRESQYRSSLLEIDRARTGLRFNGWSDRTEDSIAAAARIRVDGALRDRAIAAMAGLDARMARRFEEFGASSLAFSADGRTLLMGGLDPGQGRESRAKLWDMASDRPRIVGRPGWGPVAYRDARTPLQLTVEAGKGLILWDVARDQAVARFAIPAGSQPQDMALSSDGALVAAALRGPEESVLVWDGRSGASVGRFPGAATALAFSPDAALLACGDGQGRITVRALSSGGTIAEFRQQRVTILALAFAPDPLRGAGEERNWLLAAGGSAGSLAIWDVGAKVQRSICYGNDPAIYSLAFALGGTVLGSAGHGVTRLWDVATGQPLLDIRDAYSTSLAFHPDGRQLAIARVVFLGAPDLVHVWDLDEGRGIRTLRGLTTPPAAIFSARRGLMAGMSRDFRLATWDLEGSRLLHVRESLPGMKGLNCALAFDPEGRIQALVAGRVAQLREVDSGRDRHTWPLPPGAMESLAFHPSGKLILARAETRLGRRTPVGNSDPADPNVFRLRVYARGGDPVLSKELITVTGNVADVAAWPDGTLLIHGSDKDSRGEHWWIRVFDGLTGEEKWRRDTPPGRRWHCAMEPTGILMAIAYDEERASDLVEIRSGQTVRRLESRVASLGPDGRYWTTPDPDHPGGWSLWGAREGHLFDSDLDQSGGQGNALFSHDGRWLAWANTDGTLSVAELERVSRHVAGLRDGR